MFINPDWTHIYFVNEDLKVQLKSFAEKKLLMMISLQNTLNTIFYASLKEQNSSWLKKFLKEMKNFRISSQHVLSTEI